MLLKLIEDPKTDIVGALESKLEDNPLIAKFHEDIRVHNAMRVYDRSQWDLSPGMKNIMGQFDYLDDAWVMTYLMASVGRRPEARAIRRIFHKGYDPFKSPNPIVKGFAYVEAIETCTARDEIETLYASFDYHVGKSDDPVLRRMHPVIEELFKRRHSYLVKVEKHISFCLYKIETLKEEGDSLVDAGEYSDAQSRYRDASDIALYQLNDRSLASDLNSRLWYRQIDTFVEQGDSLALQGDMEDARGLYETASGIARERLFDEEYADELGGRADSLEDYLFDSFRDTDPDIHLDREVKDINVDLDAETGPEKSSRNPLRYIARGVGRFYRGMKKRLKKKAA